MGPGVASVQSALPRHHLYLLLTEQFLLPAPRITHPDLWLPGLPGDLLGTAGSVNTTRALVFAAKAECEVFRKA